MNRDLTTAAPRRHGVATGHPPATAGGRIAAPQPVTPAGDLVEGVWGTLQVLSPQGVDQAKLEEIASELGIRVEDLFREQPNLTPATATAVAPDGPDDDSDAPSSDTGGDFAKLALLAAAPRTRGGGAIPLGETLTSAMHNLAANKLRGLLTMLGIIIGVAAVVLLAGISTGFQGYIDELTAGNGGNNVTIAPLTQRINSIDTGKPARTLTLGDALALAEPGVVPNAMAISPALQSRVLIRAGSENVSGMLVGTWAEYGPMNGFTVVNGALFTDEDVASEARVAVLGGKIAQDLFGDTDPVGQTVWTNGHPLRVVGVLEAKGGALFGGMDTSVYAPLPVVMNRITGADRNYRDGTQAVDTIIVQARTLDTIPAVEAAVQAVMFERHGEQDFSVTSLLSALQQRQQILGSIQILMVVVAGLALIVGGIGIMNIMLVSVTERTREIGLRMAIGARGGDILTQFLVESALIGLIGAAIGLLFAGLLITLVSVLWRPSLPTVTAVAIAVGAALVTSLFFGVSPARRAAALQPIDALRAE
jgi:putative ABC transport system permease protein